MGRKFGSDIGWAVLDAVADGVEVLQNATYRPTALLRYGLANLKTMDIERERRRMKQAIRRLEKKGYLERLAQEGQCAFRVTELGECLRRSKQEPRRLPEGIWTVVSFDIPERYRGVRDVFRTCLRQAGFTRRHDSVWISDRDWSEMLQREVARLGISEWVAVIMGNIITAPQASRIVTD